MRTLAELVRWRARRHPDLEAVWYAGNSWTYRQLDKSTSRLAGALVSDLGIEVGDRVAILDKNCAAYLELIFALDKAGAVAAPINWRLTASEVKLIIEDVKPTLVVTGPRVQKQTAPQTGVPDPDVRRIAARRRRIPAATRTAPISTAILHVGHHRACRKAPC